MKLKIINTERLCYCHVCYSRIYKGMKKIRAKQLPNKKNRIALKNYHIECFIDVCEKFNEFKGYKKLLKELHKKDIREERAARLVKEI